MPTLNGQHSDNVRQPLFRIRSSDKLRKQLRASECRGCSHTALTYPTRASGDFFQSPFREHPLFCVV